MIEVNPLTCLTAFVFIMACVINLKLAHAGWNQQSGCTFFYLVLAFFTSVICGVALYVLGPGLIGNGFLGQISGYIFGVLGFLISFWVFFYVANDTKSNKHMTGRDPRFGGH